MTLGLRTEGREDKQRVLVRAGWHNAPVVGTSQVYWQGTQNGVKQAMEREGWEADGSGHHGHRGMTTRARDGPLLFFHFHFSFSKQVFKKILFYFLK